MSTIKAPTTMSKKKERTSIVSKLSPLVKLIFLTCIFASVNQIFSIILMIRNVDNNAGNTASIDVLELLQQKQEENQRLVQKMKELEKQQESIRNRLALQEKESSNSKNSDAVMIQKEEVAGESSALTRVLIGIFSFDDAKQLAAYRSRFRELFDIFIEKDDYRVCSLGNYEIAVDKQRNGELDNIDITADTSSQTSHNDNHNDKFYKKTYEKCQYIYTFVIAANVSEDAPKLIAAPVDGKDDILYPRSKESLQNHTSRDIKFAHRSKWTDMTLLNIQENMNEGKSQTWFHYAALVGEELGIDYVGKQDTDTIPYMDRFFDWINVQNRLPPSPYNKNILIGNPVNKDWWWQWKGYSLTKEQEAKEEFFKDNFENHFHIYAQGQCYIMSTDLAYFVAEEAQMVLKEGQYDHLLENQTIEQEEGGGGGEQEEGTNANLRRQQKQQQEKEEEDKSNESSGSGQQQKRYGDYIEGHEDHDVASMAFHSPYPIQFQLLTKYQLFWRHGIKNRKGVNSATVWSDEVTRMREWIPLHTSHASSDQPKNDLNVEINSLAYARR